MNKTIRKWDSKNREYIYQEVPMVDSKRTLLEEGQKVLYAKANKSSTSEIEEGKITKLGDGFVILEVVRTFYKWSEHKTVTEPIKIRLVGARGSWDVENPAARFTQLWIVQ